MRVVVTHTLAYHATNADVSIIRSSDLLKEMRSKLRKIVEQINSNYEAAYLIYK